MIELESGERELSIDEMFHQPILVVKDVLVGKNMNHVVYVLGVIEV